MTIIGDYTKKMENVFVNPDFDPAGSLNSQIPQFENQVFISDNVENSLRWLTAVQYLHVELPFFFAKSRKQ